MAAFTVWLVLGSAALEAASYGSGSKSFSSSRSSSSSSRSSSSFSSSSRSSSGSSSVFKSRTPSYSAGSSYSTPSSRPFTPASSSSGSRFDSDAAAAKKSGGSTYQPPASGSSGSSNYTRSNYTSYATPTPAPSLWQRVFGSYANRPTVSYRDPYNSTFWWWLLDRPRAERARWAYHHAHAMDPNRYSALVAADPGLEADIAALNTEKQPVDSFYTPTGIETGMMYNDQTTTYPEPAPATPEGQFWFWFWFLAGGAFLVWFIFVKRWPVSPARVSF